MHRPKCTEMINGVLAPYFLKKLVADVVGGGDARSIAQALVAFLEKCCLKKEKLLGIGTDNASVMTGNKNGVHKVLKEEYGIKDLVLIRCVCHSLQLAVTHASNDTLPCSVEYLVRETYNWFSVSPKR
ncbi:hypothetical protein JOQ06_025904 [Pogonophryne albipinna]|uniref:DUF4371 domain-containing protein n=1 Tax=Pogonophryne albipinna TaxID=1090488 RepID=A0AAD6A6Y7_9TELE|nr:hypothetical protein JOQ06_025904 [Pogonophryne albipinna]